MDVVGGAVSLAALAVFLRAWKPRQMWQHGSGWHEEAHARAAVSDLLGRITWAWTPWAVLSVAVFCWGLPAVKAVLEGRAAPFGVATTLPAAAVAPEFHVPRLDGRIAKVPPATREPQEIERAVYRFNWLSAAGTGILVAAAFSVPWLGISWRRAAVIWWHTLRGLAPSLATIAAMLSLAFVTRYSGIVVSATATGTHRQEGAILRRVFPHSLALALLMGLLVWLQSGPLAWMVPR